MSVFAALSDAVSKLAVPSVLLICAVLILLMPKKELFSEFTDGAKNGLRTAVKLLPMLTALLCAVKLLSASGLPLAIGELIRPLTEALGIPSELLPLLMTRPFSGSASLAMYSDLISDVGADTFIAFCASVIMGSSDTTVYIVSVYFSSVGVKKTRYAFPCAIAVLIFSIFFSCFISRLCFK